jgi:hypothetical protein
MGTPKVAGAEHQQDGKIPTHLPEPEFCASRLVPKFPCVKFVYNKQPGYFYARQIAFEPLPAYVLFAFVGSSAVCIGYSLK